MIYSYNDISLQEVLTNWWIEWLGSFSAKTGFYNCKFIKLRINQFIIIKVLSGSEILLWWYDGCFSNVKHDIR